MRLHHVQVACPPGGEEDARRFYGEGLGLTEVPKPDSLAGRGFRIAAISIDEGSPEDVVAFAQKLGLTFDILHDRSGTIERLYQTTGVPESFLLDRRGILVKRVIGAHDWSSPANRSTVERLLAQPES